MNFFKSLAITAISAVTLATSPASASTFTASETKLIDSLNQAGVEIQIGKCRTEGSYGYYMPAKNLIGICTNVATSPNQQWETLRHEAIHAAQRCVNHSMSFTVKSSDYLMKNGRQSDWTFIQKSYAKEDWAIELEAFTLMRTSNANVAAIVNSACR